VSDGNINFVSKYRLFFMFQNVIQLLFLHQWLYSTCKDLGRRTLGRLLNLIKTLGRASCDE
jgi:hypothetical protein